MSGPTTLGYTLLPALAELVIDEIRDVQQEYSAIQERARQRAHERAQQTERLQQARQQAQLAAARETRQLEHELLRLADLAGQAPQLPPPSTGDQAVYLHTLRGQIETLRAHLQQTRHRSQLDALVAQDNAPPPPDLENVLAQYLQTSNQQHPHEKGDRQAHERTQAIRRILQPLRAAQDQPLPVHLEALARRILHAPGAARAQALLSKLQLQAHQWQQEQTQRHQDAALARQWLQLLPPDADETLLLHLHAVAESLCSLTTTARQQATALAEDAQRQRQQQRDQAAAAILERSLRDLGYNVEEAPATLFSEGGTLHFQRPGWDDYFVRLRVNARENTVNLNMVRPNTFENTQARQRLDFAAEDRWCGEIPKLMQTLQSRGINLHIERRLGAGEVPVQAVPPQQLPTLRPQQPQERRRTAPPKARPLP